MVLQCIEQLYYCWYHFTDWVKQLVAVLNVIKDGMLAYLAIFTGFNAAKVFGATPGLGGVIGVRLY